MTQTVTTLPPTINFGISKEIKKFHQVTYLLKTKVVLNETAIGLSIHSMKTLDGLKTDYTYATSIINVLKFRPKQTAQTQIRVFSVCYSDIQFVIPVLITFYLRTEREKSFKCSKFCKHLP